MKKNNSIIKIFGIALIMISILLFWLVFFKLAPWISSTIPAGSWHSFLTILVYVGIAWIGGIGLPLIIMITGIYLFIKNG